MKIDTKLTFEKIAETIIAFALNRCTDIYKHQTYNVETPINTEFGLDSLDMVELIVEIENEYNIEIPAELSDAICQAPECQITTSTLIVTVATMLGAPVPSQYLMKQTNIRLMLENHRQTKQLKKQKNKKIFNTIIASTVLIACLSGALYLSRRNLQAQKKAIKTENTKHMQKVPTDILQKQTQYQR